MSAGTERMLVEFGRAGLVGKAKQQPEKVREVLEKIRTDGLLTTIEAVRGKLDMPIPLGYCNAGVVLDVGRDVDGFRVGDRVVSNGPHAEVVCVPSNLCARIPDAVSDDSAAFAVLGAIALQGLRLAEPTLGESFVVIGLGLVGLLSVQLLVAHGCRVLGIDIDPARAELARTLGAEAIALSDGRDAVETALAFSRGVGVDGVIIAAATRSSEPMRQAAAMCRKRGRIVLVGSTGLALSRGDFYEKELTFRVSCSYGPGRYDPSYEEKGQDYPVGFVRWTAQRNFEAVLDMMASGRLDMAPMVSHRFPIAQAAQAYEVLAAGGHLGILLEYPDAGVVSDRRLRARTVRYAKRDAVEGSIAVGLIGAGNYASRVLVPALCRAGVHLKTVASSGGGSGAYVARRYRADETTTDTDRVFADQEIDAVVIATRHDSHAELVVRALDAGKHVFCEKPLALTVEEVDRIEAAYASRASQGGPPVLMVGFNRRFAPHVLTMKRLLDSVAEPKVLIYTVNAGAVPRGHWTQDPEVGGGRIIGEGCHFIDLLRFIVGAPIESVDARAIGRAPGLDVTEDKATIGIRFADGSIGTVHYLGNGHRGFPKERLEVFCGGRVLQLDNFRMLRGYGWPRFRRMGALRQDKGHTACMTAFVHAVKGGGDSPIPFDELIEVARFTIEAAAQARDGGVVTSR